MSEMSEMDREPLWTEVRASFLRDSLREGTCNYPESLLRFCLLITNQSGQELSTHQIPACLAHGKLSRWPVNSLFFFPDANILNSGLSNH